MTEKFCKFNTVDTLLDEADSSFQKMPNRMPSIFIYELGN